MNLDGLSLGVAPGNGLVRRTRESVIFLASGNVDYLDELEASSSDPAAIGRLLLTMSPAPEAVAVLTPDFVFVFGKASASALIGESVRTVEGPDGVGGVKLDLGEAPDVKVVAGVVATDGTDFRLGTAHAGGIGIGFAAEQSVSSENGLDEEAQEVELDEPKNVFDENQRVEDQDRSFLVADLSSQSEVESSPEPLPIEAEILDSEHQEPDYAQPVLVRGLVSSGGHFNHPFATYCRISGERLGVGKTWTSEIGERPPLGVFSFDDGRSYVVKWNTVIGRQPDVDDRVQEGNSAPLALDGELTMSRAHLAIELEEWDVAVVDLSANGTELIRGGESEGPIRRGERVVLQSGDELRLGDRSCVYHSHYV